MHAPPPHTAPSAHAYSIHGCLAGTRAGPRGRLRAGCGPAPCTQNTRVPSYKVHSAPHRLRLENTLSPPSPSLPPSTSRSLPLPPSSLWLPLSHSPSLHQPPPPPPIRPPCVGRGGGGAGGGVPLSFAPILPRYVKPPPSLRQTLSRSPSLSLALSRSPSLSLATHSPSLRQPPAPRLVACVAAGRECAPRAAIGGRRDQPHVTTGHVTTGHVTTGHVTTGHVTTGHVTTGSHADRSFDDRSRDDRSRDE